MKHNPKIAEGPWEIEEIVPDCDIYICAAGTAPIAIVLGADNFPCVPPEDSTNFQADVEAIAHRIESAPDLLAACEELTAAVSWWISMTDIPHTETRERVIAARGKARAAIAKAYGESNG